MAKYREYEIRIPDLFQRRHLFEETAASEGDNKNNKLAYYFYYSILFVSY
jgi:hypothetical protein